jgi:hypothetical protein
MPIPNPNPIYIPPSPGEEFNSLWLSTIYINTQNSQSGFVNICTLPYDELNDRIASEKYMSNISTERLWDAVREVPEVAAAMDAILNAYVPLQQWINGTYVSQTTTEVEPSSATPVLTPTTEQL